MFHKLYNLFIEKDASMIEINPLAITCKGLICLDSKITIDDNAAFRQPDMKAQEDTSQENYYERVANIHELNYIHIGGDIGCLVNGAGLAMSTMDIIKIYGGEPANFLDVGGSASGE
jgi:succinyl-CoA synthetase beta subunit